MLTLEISLEKKKHRSPMHSTTRPALHLTSAFFQAPPHPVEPTRCSAPSHLTLPLPPPPTTPSTGITPRGLFSRQALRVVWVPSLRHARPRRAARRPRPPDPAALAVQRRAGLGRRDRRGRRRRRDRRRHRDRRRRRGRCRRGDAGGGRRRSIALRDVAAVERGAGLLLRRRCRGAAAADAPGPRARACPSASEVDGRADGAEADVREGDVGVGVGRPDVAWIA